MSRSLRLRDRVAVALALALLTVPLVPAQPASAERSCVLVTTWRSLGVRPGVINVVPVVTRFYYESDLRARSFKRPLRSSDCTAARVWLGTPRVVVTDAVTEGRVVLSNPIPSDARPSLTLDSLPDPLRVGTQYAPTARLSYYGRPLANREVRLTVGYAQATARTDGVGSATFSGFTPGGGSGAYPGVYGGSLEFAGDASGDASGVLFADERVTFTRTVLPADPPPPPPTALAARFLAPGVTELSWTAPASGSLSWDYNLNGGGYGGSYFVPTSSNLLRLALVPGSYTFQVRARDPLGRVSDSARVGFTQPAATTALSGWVWSPVPARLGSSVSTRADLTWTAPASLFQQPGSGPLAGSPLTFSLGSQTFSGSASVSSTATVRTGPGTLPTSVAFAGDTWYAPARLTGTLVVVPNDTPPPSVPVVTVTPPVNTANLFTLQASSTDNLGGSGVVQLDVSVDGAGYFLSGSSQTAQPAWTMTYGPAPLARSFGQHTVQVRARDGAGNISAASAPVPFEWRGRTAHLVTGALVQSACSAAGVPVGTVTVRGVLLDQDNRPVADGIVTIIGGGLPNSARTATDGSVSFSGRTGRSFTLSFQGDRSHAAAATPVTADAQPPCAPPPPVVVPPPPPVVPPPPIVAPPPPAQPAAPPSYSVDIPPP